MINTAIAFSSAWPNRGSGPTRFQTTNVAVAIATTSGPNQPETRSATAWIGARLRCAAATIFTIRASTVSDSTARASITSAPVPLTVPPVTVAPPSFRTGMASPVSIDSSTEDPPSTTTPSTGIAAPGRTRRRSPAATSAKSTCSSLPSAPMRSADLGARFSSARIARPAAARARSSSTWPNSTRVTTTPAAS